MTNLKRIYIVLVIIIIMLCSGCRYTPERPQHPRINESELLDMVKDDKYGLSECAKLLYSKPDFWKSIDEDRTDNWSVYTSTMAKNECSDYFTEEEWSKIIDTLHDAEVTCTAYYIDTAFDRAFPRVEFMFISDESVSSRRVNYWKSFLLEYIPQSCDTDKYGYMKSQFHSIRVDELYRINDEWYYYIREEGIPPKK